MSQSKLNYQRREPLLAAFAMDHEKSQPLKVGFFVSGTEVREGCA